MTSGAPSRWDVVVVGGGAAGMFGAISCAESNPELRVLVLEGASKSLGKVRISGGGRCNVTHACFDPAELTDRYPRGKRELRGPFHAWQPEDTVSWFESRGVPLKTESDGRMFPQSDTSQSIVDCLLNEAARVGVTLQTGSRVNRIQRQGDGFVIELSDGVQHSCRKLLLAIGGLKPGPLLDQVKGFGHNIETLAPSLFTFHVDDPRIAELQGLAVEDAEVSVAGARFVHRGPVLITHWGLSGPAILKLSAWAARWAQDQGYRFHCRINWVPAFTADQLSTELDQSRVSHSKRFIRKVAPVDLPSRLWERLVKAAGIDEQKQWGQMSRANREGMVLQLTQGEFAVSGKSMFKEEFVTCGGVRLSELNFKTMESRIVPGLHFAGEMIDVDGITGGFNFQAAWTTGRLAGQAMAAVESTD